MTDLYTKAYNFAREAHASQVDDNGDPYFNHCQHVMEIVAQVTEDVEMLAAALLHDVIEDTDTTYEDLVREFPQRVADLVYEVTHEGRKDNYGYYFPRLKSKDAILIKLADRMSNITRMESWDDDRREHYLKRTKFWKDGSDR